MLHSSKPLVVRGGLEAALVDKSVISDPGGLGHGYQGKLHEYCAVRLCLKMFFIQ